MYNILIEDYINKCKFIFDITPKTEKDFHYLLDTILNEINQSIKEELHVSFISSNECEVYKYKENLQKGWIWNTISSEKIVLYKLTPLVVINSEILNLNEKLSTSTQTIIPKNNDNFSQTEILEKENKSIFYIKDDYILDDIPLEITDTANHFGNTNSFYNSDPIPFDDTLKKSTVDNSNLFDNTNFDDLTTFEFSEDIDVSNNSTYNYDWPNDLGYAKNCFSPNWKCEFKTELEKKLNTPNYGLEKFKKDKYE
jgi:hypothetical protein